MESNKLIHYGVKGMKWGVRRYQNPDGALKNPKRKKSNIKKKAAMIASPVGYAAYKGYKNSKTKQYAKSDYAKAKSMTDEELRKRVNRINLEQSYIQAMVRDTTAAREAGQTALTKHGSKTVKYITSLTNQKKFKEKASGVAAKMVFK